MERGREVVGLPERRPDPREIADTQAAILQLPEGAIVEPDLVTIARSVDDGFTPAETWPGIERQLLTAIRSVHPHARIRLHPGVAAVDAEDGPTRRTPAARY